MIRRIKSGRTQEATAEQQTQVRRTVEEILVTIGARGEAAVREYSEKFDKWSPASFRLTADEIEACISALPRQTIADIEFAQAQIRNFALAQRAAAQALPLFG